MSGRIVVDEMENYGFQNQLDKFGEDNSPINDNIEDILDNILRRRAAHDRSMKAAGGVVDSDVLRCLLHEKDRDLLLAAQVGQNLLLHNKELSTQVEFTKQQLEQLSHERNQLRHEVSIKEDLLKVYQSELDASESTENDISVSLSSPFHSRPSSVSDNRPSDRKMPNNEETWQLKKRIRQLEMENEKLKDNHDRRSSVHNAAAVDHEEDELVKNCVRQLTEANSHMKTLSDSLTEKSDKYIFLQSDMTVLLAKNIDLASHVKQLTFENDSLTSRFEASQQQQSVMLTQLKELRDRYDESISTLNTFQEEVRRLRKREKRLLLENQRFQLRSSMPREINVITPESLSVTSASVQDVNSRMEDSPQVHFQPARRPSNLSSQCDHHDDDAAATYQQHRLADKLKLVKPIEGSSTLRHWQELATPDFAGALLDCDRPGVQHRTLVCSLRSRPSKIKRKESKSKETPIQQPETAAAAPTDESTPVVGKPAIFDETHPQTHLASVVPQTSQPPLSLIHQLTSVPALANQRNPPPTVGLNITEQCLPSHSSDAHNDVKVPSSLSDQQNFADLSQGLNVMPSLKRSQEEDNAAAEASQQLQDDSANNNDNHYVLRRCALPNTPLPSAYEEEVTRRRWMVPSGLRSPHVIHRYQT